MHSHAARVILVLKSFKVREYYPNWKSRIVEGHRGQVMWRERPVRHAVKNIGDTYYQDLFVELKEPLSKLLTTHGTLADSLDALVAAPDNHKLLFENHRVRVLEVEISPGHKVAAHAYRWPSVWIADAPAKLRVYDAGGWLLVETAGAAEFESVPIVRWIGPTSVHSVENVDIIAVHGYRVEIKPVNDNRSNDK